MNETTIQIPVTFTQQAIDEVKRLMEVQGFDQTSYLRVGVKGGGCSGMTYILGFDEKKEQDEVYQFEGLTYIMERSHEMYLLGMEIDWHGGLNARGFTFSNPNASKTCGCGTSFAV
ncbi:MAG TPA: iron-sulfur cluster assembly accessory protein [Flavitalea sp.]|nr:iron-sulfur cluster assembly accessory protein [Flavitalea sp.]